LPPPPATRTHAIRITPGMRLERSLCTGTPPEVFAAILAEHTLHIKLPAVQVSQANLKKGNWVETGGRP